MAAVSPARSISGIAFGLAVLATVLVLHRMGSGIDLTDEGFYLNWVQSPRDYPAALTFFGFIYRPLFLALDGDIVLFRQVNLVVTLLLSAWLMREMLWRAGASGRTAMKIGEALLILPLALSGWMLLRWLPTPSYNWLTLQGMLVAAIGGARLLAKAETDQRPWPVTTVMLAGVLIGTGGFLTAFAKPVSGVALGAVLLILSLPLDRVRVMALGIAGVVACSLALLVILMIDGSVAAFATRITLGLEQLSLLDGGQRVLPLDRPPLFLRGFALGLVPALIVFGLIRRGDTGADRIAVAASAVLAAAAALWLWRGDLMPVARHWADGLMLSLGLAAVLLACGALEEARRHWRLICFLGLMPVVFTAGTNNNFWLILPMALVFWVALAVRMIAVAAAGARRDRALAACAFVVTFAVSVGLALSLETPYRQKTPLRLQTETAIVGPSGTALRLDREAAAYGTALRAAIMPAGGPAVAILDMTGFNPAAIHLAGASALAAPWLIGGYQGSAALIGRQIALVDCARLARAWLLTADGDDLPFMQRLLEAQGLDPARAYQEVARARSPRDGRIHRLLRPSGEPAMAEAVCRARRAALAPRS